MTLKAGTALLSVLITVAAAGQTTVNRDPAIQQMVNDISRDSLRSYINTLVSFGTRHTLSTQTNPSRGIGAARKWVLAKFDQFAAASGGRLSAIIDTTVLAPDQKRVDAPVVLGNVVATLKGSDPSDDRILIISGHLDNMRTNIMDRTSDAPGANDDGSGTAAVLECARVMSRHSFPSTIMFIAVSGEEQGLLGADYMASKSKRENRNIEAVLNNDIIGSSSGPNITDNTKLRVFSEGLPFYQLEKNARTIRQMGLENDGQSRQLARYVKEIGERYVDQIEVVMVYRPDRFLRSGDHIPYIENGYTAVRLTEMNENFAHQHQDVRMENGMQYGDLPQFMDFEYLRKNTAVNLAAIASLASAASPPQELKLDVSKLSNDTHLFWKSPRVGRCKGYFVLLRETTSPVWQKKIFTTATDMLLPYSKDNYFFAVQSVSDDGHESLPEMPSAERN